MLPASSDGTVLADNISHLPAQMLLFVPAGGLCPLVETEALVHPLVPVQLWSRD
jgi:hypothetical protein